MNKKSQIFPACTTEQSLPKGYNGVTNCNKQLRIQQESYNKHDIVNLQYMLITL